MKETLSGYWLMRKAKTILIFLIVLLIIVSVGYFCIDDENKWNPILGGLATGLLLVIVQYLFSWYEHVEREKLARLGLENALDNKRKREYYGDLIQSANTSIDLMGKTGYHFLEDFANSSGSHKETNALFEALRKPNMRVRFLFPSSRFLTGGDQNRATESEAQLKTLKSKYTNFTYRYFDHVECHSIFIADDDVIIGPFFPGLPSMDTPALHVRADAYYARKYLEYFDAEWDKCSRPE